MEWDCKSYVIEFEFCNRKVELQKVDWIVENIYSGHVQRYLLTKPIPMEKMKDLQGCEMLRRLWVDDLKERGSVYFSKLPSLIGLFEISSNYNISDLVEIFFSHGDSGVGAILVAENSGIIDAIRHPYQEVLDGPLMRADYYEIMRFNGVKFLYQIPIEREYRNDGGSVQEYLFLDTKPLTYPSLFDWSKIVMSTSF